VRTLAAQPEQVNEEGESNEGDEPSEQNRIHGSSVVEEACASVQ
jgi:hypothetical protein